jgi:hypothetical protein
MVFTQTNVFFSDKNSLAQITMQSVADSFEFNELSSGNPPLPFEFHRRSSNKGVKLRFENPFCRPFGEEACSECLVNISQQFQIHETVSLFCVFSSVVFVLRYVVVFQRATLLLVES